jgi:tRNA pseudouridine13 synthase
VSEAREYYKRTQDADGALHRMPRYLTAERALLVSLKRDASNYLQAINCIPRTMRLMYVHSYQSFLWNHAASHRTRSHGVEAVVEGDLVYSDEAEGSEPTAEVLKTRESESLTTSEEMETTEVLDEVVDADVTAGGPCKVKCVTADDILSGRYQIWDVLLPLPGCSTLYPANDTANIYEDLARKDLVDLHVCTHNVK